MLLLFLNLAILIYTGYNHPLEGRMRNTLEYFNEIMVCYITFHMFYFTDWVGMPPDKLIGTPPRQDEDGRHDRFWLPNKPLQEWYGYAMLFAIAYFMYVNLSIISFYSIRGLFLIQTKFERIYRKRPFICNKEDLYATFRIKMVKRIPDDKVITIDIMGKLNEGVVKRMKKSGALK